MPKIIKSTCVYCGCGCQLNYEIDDDGAITKILPVQDDPVSRGKPCVKGLTIDSIDHKDRITYPMIINGTSWDKCTIDEAIKNIYENTKNLNAEEVAFIGSGDTSNEDNFVLSKFARVVFSSNNIDCCARLCHGSSATAMRKMFGNAAMPDYIDDLLSSDLIITTGTNPAGNYPVAFQRVLEAKKNGTKLVCIDIETSETTNQADFFLNINFTEITTLYGGLIKKIIDEKIYDKGLETNEGFEDLVKSVALFDIKTVCDKCKIDPEEFDKVFGMIKTAKKITFMHGMGATQHANGVNNVCSILNTAILTRANIIPMRGKINVQGAGDMGTCPDWKPFGGSPSQTKEVWGEVAIDTPGHHLTEFCYSPNIKAIFILVSNPAQSMPDLNLLHEKFKSTFIVYMHHHPSKTSEFADVIIPVPMLNESDGTISNAERRITRVNKINQLNKGVDPAWKFLSKLAKLYGKETEFKFNESDDVFLEIVKTIPAYANLDIEKIKKTNINFADKEKFFERLLPVDSENPERDIKGNGYDFLLTTQRSPYHFCTGELTRRNKKLLTLLPEAICEVNKVDADGLGINDGELIEVESKIDKVIAKAKVSTDFKQGIITLPFHFEKCLVNKLFDLKLDPISKQPNLKSAWVKINKLAK